MSSWRQSPPPGIDPQWLIKKQENHQKNLQWINNLKFLKRDPINLDRIPELYLRKIFDMQADHTRTAISMLSTKYSNIISKGKRDYKKFQPKHEITSFKLSSVPADLLSSIIVQMTMRSAVKLRQTCRSSCTVVDSTFAKPSLVSEVLNVIDPPIFFPNFGLYHASRRDSPHKICEGLAGGASTMARFFGQVEYFQSNGNIKMADMLAALDVIHRRHDYFVFRSWPMELELEMVQWKKLGHFPSKYHHTFPEITMGLQWKA